MSRLIARALLGGAALAMMSPSAAAQQREGPRCSPEGAVVRVAELPEGSGVAASRRNPKRFWAHNDSGEPTLVALDAQGAVISRLRLSGASVEDWEAIAAGPCPSGSCLYVGDIGDNDAERRRITVYRVADTDGTSAPAEAFHATYPDGPHDAEALFVTPAGEIFIVTKGETGTVALYRFPRELRAGATVELSRVAVAKGSGTAKREDRITDAAISPDGTWVVLRTIAALRFYRAADLMAGTWQEAGRVDLAPLKEPQGEGVTFGDARTLYLVGEGGGKKQPGTFSRMTCTF